MTNPEHCQERVYTPGYTRGNQCSRKAVVDGKWCKQHDPVAKKKRMEASAAKWNADWKRKQEEIKHDKLLRDLGEMAYCAGFTSLEALEKALKNSGQ